jgi:hypothetical protein
VPKLNSILVAAELVSGVAAAPIVAAASSAEISSLFVFMFDTSSFN